MRGPTPRIAAALAALPLLLGMACSEDATSTDAPPPSARAPSTFVTTAAPSVIPSDIASPTVLPAITVDQPATGAEVSSPVVVAGTADVFEATVSMRILDSSGAVLVRDFTTATCGTGCRGDYEKRLRFSVVEPGPGVIEVWWDSPKDGSRQDVVRIPVTLVP